MTYLCSDYHPKTWDTQTMIKSLHIENYALIESLDIELRKGFSVITGETGAGKSIILGAIGLLCGQRADTKSIKTGAKRCVVEAEFDVGQYGMGDFFQQNDLDFDGTECIVRRELTSAGKSRAFINDSPVGLTTLKELGERLIDIHSQHQNLLLGKEDFQLNILDTMAKNADRLADYQQQYHALRQAEKALAEAIEAAKQSKDDEDYLRFQYNQLEEAKLVEGEQAALEEESELLEHAEEIKQELSNAEACIDGGEYMQEGQEPLLQQMKQAMAALRSISDKMKTAEELANRVESCYIEMKDIADEISQEADSIEFRPERLEQVQERLATLYALEKKHKVDSVEELIALSLQLSERLMLIDNSEEVIEELRQNVAAAKKKAVKAAEELSKQRQKAAKDVEQRMVESLVPLGMPNVQFKVDVRMDTEKLTSTGADTVEFLFSANKNAALQAVKQVASGGEIARVMLSLKALIASEVKLPTIIFDEIDTGVSGSIAEKMARIMQKMGEQNRQVISITHLPQIAALGSCHYKVYKQDKDEQTNTHIVELGEEERVEEIAHMLSGEVLSEAAIENARALIKLK